jgi:hypothetical protein
MSIAFAMDGSILRIVFSGTLTNEDLLNAAREVADLERAHAIVPHRLSDLRPVTRLEINFQGVLELANRRLALEFPNAFKSAIVATDVAHFGFARMFQTLNDHPQIAIAIFGSDADARSWLAEPGQRLPERPWTPELRAI